jgi:hypothetical protein
LGLFAGAVLFGSWWSVYRISPFCILFAVICDHHPACFGCLTPAFVFHLWVVFRFFVLFLWIWCFVFSFCVLDPVVFPFSVSVCGVSMVPVFRSFLFIYLLLFLDLCRLPCSWVAQWVVAPPVAEGEMGCGRGVWCW